MLRLISLLRYLQLNGQNLGQKFGIFGIPGDTTAKRREENARTNIYHHAKFHIDHDRCDRR